MGCYTLVAIAERLFERFFNSLDLPTARLFLGKLAKRLKVDSYPSLYFEIPCP